MAIDFASLMPDVARELLGEPNARLSSAKKWRYGTHGSLSVDLVKGTWYDNEAGGGPGAEGGVRDLIAAKTGTNANGGATEWLKQHGFPIEDTDTGDRDVARRDPRRIVAEYEYLDEMGMSLFQVVRFEPKDFRQRRKALPTDDPGAVKNGWVWSVKGVRLVPYKLPELIETLSQDRPVYIVEGEKDVENLAKLGVPATSGPMGAGKWQPGFKQYFEGADVIVIEDNDPPAKNPDGTPKVHPDGRPVLPGQDHARDVCNSLLGTAKRVRLLSIPGLPPKGDVSDWINAGGDAIGLYKLVESEAGDWSPSSATLRSVSAASFDGVPVPPRLWHVQDLIPVETVTSLSGDGDAGKSLLAMQLAAATVAQRMWLGREVRSGRAIYFSAEDDINEIHRRLVDIARGMDIKLADLQDLRIVPLSEEADTVLAAPDDKSDLLKPTPLWHRVEALVAEWRPVLVVFDPRADLFGGNEISRLQSRQFIAMLRGLALRHHTAVLLLDHPSVSGITSGSGLSGSTAWHNSVRSRFFLERVVTGAHAAELDGNRRTLTSKKANYAKRADNILIQWRAGVFELDDGSKNEGATASRDTLHDLMFINLIEKYRIEGRSVSATPSANYAPAVFAKDSDSQGVSKQSLLAAMNRLLHAGRIRIEEFGPPSKRQRRLVVVNVEQFNG